MARLLSSSLSYSSLNGLTLDSNLFEIVSSRLQLKLAPNPGQIFSEDFTDDTGFTYNSNLAEFIGGEVRQRDQTAASSIFASLFGTANLNWHKNGSTTGTLNGSPTIVEGKLVCTGSQGVYFVDNTNTTETFKFRYTPNYETNPPSNINVFSIYNGSNNNDRFDLTHSPSGTSTLRFTLYGSTGNTVITVATIVGGSWSFTQDQEYEFEVNIDSVSGVVRLFIDGALHGANSPGAWTRGTASSRYYLGASPSIYNTTEATFDDCIKFSGVQHTSGYTPGYTLTPTIYVESQVSGPAFAYTGVGTVLSVDDSTVQETGAPRFTIDAEYHDGTSWVASNGTYAQANTSTDLIANLGTFTGDGSPFAWSVVFPDSNTRATVDFFSIEVTGQIYTQGGVKAVHDTIIKTDELSSVTSDASVAGSDSIKYYVLVDSTPKYFDGAAWVVSDESLSQSNTLAEINDNADTLDVSSGTDLQLGVVVNSDDGKTTPSIGTATVSYDFWAGDPSEFVTAFVYGWIYDEENAPVSGASVYSESTTQQESGDTLVLSGNKQRVSTNMAGYWEMELVPGTYNFIIDGTSYSGIVIPAQDSIGIGALV